jgi:subtilisin family serine protease
MLVSLTHGEQVSLIAGGSQSLFTGITGETGVYTGPLDLGTYTDVSNFSVNLSSSLHGVAKDASIFRNDFLTYQSSTNGLFSEFKRWGESADTTGTLYKDIKVFNLSLGYTSSNPQNNLTVYQNQLSFANSSKVPDAVFVKAAGNSGCSVSSTACDPLNAVLFNSPNFKEKSIIVGALTQPGGTIASYSNRAGSYADRFVVADGRGVLRTDGTYLQGTSFAAPRVSGYIAILRQKFPNLIAEQAAAIILDTAQWNSVWGAKDQNTQAIYGRGEANVNRALAPVGLLR